MSLEIRNLERRFGSCAAVDGLDLSLPEGAIGCLLGPSGCGKTTALRCIAGFEPADRGEIRAHGHVLCGPGVAIPPHLRRLSFSLSSPSSASLPPSCVLCLPKPRQAAEPPLIRTICGSSAF